MKIVGLTTQKYAIAASNNRPFRINEILIIQDESNGDLIAEVIETSAFNQLFPNPDFKQGAIDEEILNNLRQWGYKPEAGTIYTAKLRTISPATKPITVGASVRIPDFKEIAPILCPVSLDRGLKLGVILGTEELILPPELQNVAPLFNKDRGVIPQNGVPFLFNYRAMEDYPHIGVFGGSGSGKSFAIRVLAEELMQKRVPALIFDPHNEMTFTEKLDENYGRSYPNESEIFTIGVNIAIPFEDLTADQISIILTAAGGDFNENQKSTVQVIHEPNDTVASFKGKLNYLILMHEAGDDAIKDKMEGREKEFIKLIRMKAETHPSTLKMIKRRLARLEREGIFGKGAEKVFDTLLNRKTAIIRGPIWTLNVLASYILRAAYDKRREYLDAIQRGERPIPPKFPPFFVIADEAHNFAPKTTEINSPARYIFKEISLEGRKYGIFLILGTQRPALLDSNIVAQLNSKIILRTVRSDDLATIKAETDMSNEEIALLPFLPSGTAYVASAITGRTLPIRIRAPHTKTLKPKGSFDELDEDFPTDLLWEIVKSYLPLKTIDIIKCVDSISDKYERPVTVEDIINLLEEKVRGGEAIKKGGVMGQLYNSI